MAQTRPFQLTDKGAADRAAKHFAHPSMMPLVEPASATGLPQRLDPSHLSEAIPLFFIGQNRDGFWVARDFGGLVGGIFFSRKSAVNFANRTALPEGCATMYLSEGLELDVENKDNSLVARIGPAKRVLTRSMARLPCLAGKATRRD